MRDCRIGAPLPRPSDFTLCIPMGFLGHPLLPLSSPSPEAVAEGGYQGGREERQTLFVLTFWL
jgi:hypothetical protein